MFCAEISPHKWNIWTFFLHIFRTVSRFSKVDQPYRYLHRTCGVRVSAESDGGQDSWDLKIGRFHLASSVLITGSSGELLKLKPGNEIGYLCFPGSQRPGVPFDRQLSIEAARTASGRLGPARSELGCQCAGRSRLLPVRRTGGCGQVCQWPRPGFAIGVIAHDAGAVVCEVVPCCPQCS